MSKGFSLRKLVRENVLAMKPYASARDEYKTDGRKMTFLDANENPFETGLNRYPDPQQRNLKEILGLQKKIRTENILLGNGSDEVLDLIFRAFCEPKEDNVITLPPTYGMYKVLAELNSVGNKEVLLKENFQPNVDGILQEVDQNTKIIFLCSPNNPTGNTFSEAAITELLQRFSGVVVIDEAYIDFSEEQSWLYKLESFPNLIIIQTLSKAYGLAGIRLGMCFASAEIIQILNKIKPPYNVNDLTQQKAKEKLQNFGDVRQEISTIVEQRRVLENQLRKMVFVKEIYPSEANFLLIKVDDANWRYRQLLQNRIVIRNRSSQPLCENTLRLTVGTPVENEKLIAVLHEIEQEKS